VLPRWLPLRGPEHAVFRAAYAFLRERLCEIESINWALKLGPNDAAKRIAVLHVLDTAGEHAIGQPWLEAWRLIEESWKHLDEDEHGSVVAYDIQRRLQRGDRSLSLANDIADFVTPRLKVEAFSSLHSHFRKSPKSRRRVDGLFSTSVASSAVLDPAVVNFQNVTDVPFLLHLANILDGAVFKGLSIAKRIGWDPVHRPWRLGPLRRVYYVPPGDIDGGQDEPDKYSSGVAPSVKLLHAVVARIATQDRSKAIEFAKRWWVTNSPVHLRLWAALSRDPDITSVSDVEDTLITMGHKDFWDVSGLPEVAELRARRYAEMSVEAQAKIAKRVRKGPPRSIWPARSEADQIRNQRQYLAVLELRRIEVAGGRLPAVEGDWLRANIADAPGLAEMARLDQDFQTSPRARWVGNLPDRRYDNMEGEARLDGLNSALSTSRASWTDDPAERAGAWMRETGNNESVLMDIEATRDAGANFPRVWEAFAWSYTPPPRRNEGVRDPADLVAGRRVLALINRLPLETIREAIDGISSWLGSWEDIISSTEDGLLAWFKVWPIAVASTNARTVAIEPSEPAISPNLASEDNRVDMDTLNTPTGKLVGYFLRALPSLVEVPDPFALGCPWREMRAQAIAAGGRSTLIAKHRMIESALPYFLRADRQWTDEHLLIPLKSDDDESRSLWKAISRRTQFAEVLEHIGLAMIERANDTRLSRDVRRMLVFSLVVETLHAYRQGRPPAVPGARVLQMLRSLEDEVRAHAAATAANFVREMTGFSEDGGQPLSPELLFERCVVPFVQTVWPQERTLVTPGVSKAWATLPAAARGKFADAVVLLERFLVPFECWSMLDYGLYGNVDGEPGLTLIDSPSKAAALLKLLDRTVGIAEGAVVPYELSRVLDHIRSESPQLAYEQSFRRLASQSRR
jgi:hypothetical protein